MKGSRFKLVMGKLLHVTIAFVLAVFTMECVIRNIKFLKPPINGGFHKTIAPNSTAVYRLEGSGVSHWNEDGVRSNLKPPYSNRPILVIGDSFTEALQVYDNEVFTSLLEDSLVLNGSRTPILNLGFSGGALPHYVSDADRYKSYFAPIWVVVQLRDEDLTTEAWGKDGPRFVKDEMNGKISCVPAVTLQPSQSITRRFFVLASQYFSVPRHANSRIKEFRLMAKNEAPLFNAGYSNVTLASRGTDPGMYPIAREIELLSNVYEGRLTILYIAPYDPIAPMSVSSMESELSEVCRQQKIGFVTTRSLHGRFISRNISPFGFSNSNFNVGHCNRDGHQAIADLLSHELVNVVRP